MGVINLSKNTVLVKKVIIADRFYSRLKGLLGRDSLDEQEGLVIKPANSIHTFFMRFSIDVLFANKENKIVGLRENVKPFKLIPPFLKAFLVVELPANTVQKTKTQIGDIIQIEA